ncbi:hypothetical protein BDP27DRAFT_1430066 [Rhodocollybia butyracea]|uniref:Uncharacterized protein n=1 Tax=Rhodocollybia butyracea TaxID=206335 RepID=A0A9P5TZL7_9AGAR|nr:hypothetical protein BDP27DRAFT_1430517 [Rhodocollybia butyracea]KAF9060497.1 hypothetical protein BDP27DRAFT_1430066 [Rhodocollybia butyracea]
MSIDGALGVLRTGCPRAYEQRTTSTVREVLSIVVTCYAYDNPRGLANMFTKLAEERKMMSENDLDGLMDRSYKVGMRGMYTLMNLMDNGVFVYPEEAQLMVPVLEKVLTVTEDNVDDDMVGQKDCVQQLRNLFAKCSDKGYLFGVGE